MSQEIEIEFKNLLSEKEYTDLLLQYGGSQPNTWRQTNHYADTPDFKLKQAGCALRIRMLAGKNECTLKTPYKNHLLETTFYLNDEQAEHMITSNNLALSEEMLIQLKDLNISPQSLQFFGSLTTERFEKEIGGHLVVLDKSFYGNVIDFELEIETENEHSGKKFFNDLLQANQIPVRKTHNKIKRAMDEWQKGL